MRTPFGSVRRGAALACCLSAGVLLSLAAGTSWAGLAGSKHDFSGLPGGTFTPAGDCSACHVPHKSDPNGRIWSRNLSAEQTYFSQQASPNYLPGSTLLCYDCHDDMVSVPDQNPPASTWDSGHEPQDVAFADGPASPPSTSAVGYYELSDGTVPTVGNPAPTPPGSPPVTTATGGHFFKAKLGQAPNGGYGLGDKLACAICHDPHVVSTGTNEVMLRTAITVGGTITIGDGLKASSKTRNHTTGTGRQMCAGCHQYSDTAGAEKVLFNVRIIKPPAMAFVGHNSGDTAAECTACHAHNALDCGTCHGSPPPGAAASYAGITEAGGPHPRHARTVAGGGYGFSCALCHSQFPTGHQNAAFQDVSFLAGKNPAGAYVAGTRTCNNLYCHSRGARINDTVNNLGASGRAWTSTPDWSANDLGCEACHGSNPARAAGLMNYGAPGYANQTVIDGAAKANSHQKHAAYPCARCHYNVIRDTDPAGGWTLFDVTLHANNTTTGFTFNVNPDPNATGAKFADSYSYDAAGGTCSAIDCHNGNSAQWGATLACTDCHARTNAAGGDRDDWDIANGTAALIDSDQWSANAFPATGHGRSSGWYPWPDNNGSTTPANLGCLTTDGSGDTPVGGCHAAKVPHGLATNPFRLATPNNTTFAFENPSGTINGDSVNLFCQTCHAATLEKTHSKAITGDWGLPLDWGDPAGAPIAFKCTDCHDPHGDSPDYMIHAKVFAESSTDYGVPVQSPPSTGLGIQPTGAQVVVFDVTTPSQTQADYVDTSAGSSTKICQVCHQANSYFTRATAVAHNAGTECMGCHAHKEGFKPSRCEFCHDSTPFVQGSATAPNVMGPGSNADGTGTTPKPYDDGAWGYNVSGHGANGTASVTFDTDMSDTVTNILDPDAACEDCHTLQSHHNNGVLNSAVGGSPQANTYHLSTTGTWPFVQAGDTGSTVQTRFDSACYNRCHAGASVLNMRHAFVAPPVSQFGNKGSLPNGEDIHGRTTPAWPIDSDLTTSATTTDPDYVPCVTCHEPHGTNVSEPTYPSNRMMRAKWQSENTLCVACHL